MSQFPLYQCHKRVRAAKIASITKQEGEGAPANSSLIEFEDATIAALSVPNVWLGKHQPQPGGYLVIYEDGYSSYSPAEVFEAGYTRLPAADPSLAVTIPLSELG